MKKRKICVITGSRADYGPLKPLLDCIKGDSGITMQLIVTGMHLSREFGFTYKEIIKDGFIIDRKIDILLTSDTPVGISRSMAIAMANFTKAYKMLKPDIVVVLGDRFEIFSAAAAAYLTGVVIAHIHGGEVTEGAIDDAFRHSITKMSYLHFTAAERYRQRVVQLGEDPRRVFNVGAPGLDTIQRIHLLSTAALEKELGFKFKKHNLLVTFHPPTLGHEDPGGQFKALLDDLDALKDTGIIFTKANADPGGRIINTMIDKYVNRNPEKTIAFASMGQRLYLSTMRYVDAIVGNSSSGIIEAPSFKIGTINIGDRQKGRIKAESVIDCAPTKSDIRHAFKKLYSQDFQKRLKNVINPFGDGNSTHRIKTILKKYDCADARKKIFFDLTSCVW
jgi:GDP/UDP-N,N'-diacetylbacillosamine 2-epimerase (hydrolysing)